MTLIGLIFLILILVCWRYSFSALFGLLVVSTIFNATSMLDIAGKSIPPYFFCAVALILKYTCINGFTYFTVYTRSLRSFLLYSTIVGLFCPILFEGIKVLPASLDTGVANGGIPLNFSMNHIAQLLYLYVNILTLACIWKKRNEISVNIICRSFFLSLSIILFLGYWDYISKFLGIIPFPSGFFYNSNKMNTDLGGQYISTVRGYMRFNSLFTEASFCGAYLAASFWAIVVNGINTAFKKVYLIIIVIAIMLSMSGTAILGMLAGAVAFFVMKKDKVKIVLCFSVIALVLSNVLSNVEIISDLFDILSDKAESQSGVTRAESISYSWNVFQDTYFLGAGFGSTRSSSFFFDTLASVGIIGLILFYRSIYKLLAPISMYNKYIVMYVIVMFATQIMAIPDISFGSFWMGMYCVAALNRRKEQSYFVTK